MRIEIRTHKIKQKLRSIHSNEIAKYEFFIFYWCQPQFQILFASPIKSSIAVVYGVLKNHKNEKKKKQKEEAQKKKRN